MSQEATRCSYAPDELASDRTIYPVSRRVVPDNHVMVLLVRVIAGPGSGKTRVLAARAAELALAPRIQPWQIMVLTFTNKAGQEIKERLASVVGEDAAEGMVTGKCVGEDSLQCHVVADHKSALPAFTAKTCVSAMQEPSTPLLLVSSGCNW